MKSRIINSAGGRIIAYKQQTNINALNDIAGKFRIKLISANDDDAETQLGYFAGFEGFTPSEKKGEAEKGCIIFTGLSGKQIDLVLAELRKAKIVIPLKAVLTPSNQSWSIKKLVAELEKERSQLGG
ncbi:MAG: DUF3783 domain-containing protein [Oscillospiraceae bacterium]